MESRYRVVAGRSFDKDLRRIRRRAPRMLEVLREAGALLADDPYNRRGRADISKLVDVRPGEGQFRLRLGDWRLRYDVVGEDVVLHSMRPRSESYRP
jgi:mRNA-degrading endonuclease RelE of RelBE toxin-antitoxin system